MSAPYLIRKTAEAKAYEIKAIAEALKLTCKEGKLHASYSDGAIQLWQKSEDKTLNISDSTLAERAACRIDYQARKKQANIENVTTNAAKYLARENEVSESEPDEDWITRFFNSAQDISSQEMQQLWGKILAGEIKQPGTYSLRALDVLRNLTKSEAQAIEKIGRFALNFHGQFIIPIALKDWLQNERDYQSKDHYCLIELGLLHSAQATTKIFQNEGRNAATFISNEHLLVVQKTAFASEFSIEVWSFTNIGREILSLIHQPFDEQYLETFGKIFAGSYADVGICKIDSIKSDGHINFTVLKEVQRDF